MAFVAISRLSSKRLLGAQYPLLKAHNVPAMSSATGAVHPSIQKDGESFDEKNARLNRPMSPHLTIYKLNEMTSTLSITHRFTGIALSAYAIALAGAAFCPADFNTICASIEAANPGAVSLFTAKFILALPFTYHTCNGVRHLMWDTGSQLNKEAVVTTGTVMLAATVVTTALVMLL